MQCFHLSFLACYLYFCETVQESKTFLQTLHPIQWDWRVVKQSEKLTLFFSPDIENFGEVGSGWCFFFFFFSVTCAVWALRACEHGAKNGFSFPDAFETSPAAVQGRSLAAPAPSECPPLNGACWMGELLPVVSHNNTMSYFVSPESG